MQKLDISLYVPGLPFNGETATQQSLGGSETAGYYLAKELAKLGHYVTVFSNGAPGRFEGVVYRSIAEYELHQRMNPHDVAIVQRIPETFARRHASKLNILWCHDLALGRQVSTIRGVLWNTDKIVVLSEFMREQYKQTYGLSDDTLFITRNGIDCELFNTQAGTAIRDRKALVYAARPERGLDNLLERILPKLLKQEPGITLHLCSYKNPVEHLAGFYQALDSLMKRYGPSVVWHGELNKADLVKLYKSCGVYVYPTPSQINEDFAEISCISAMEAQAAGLPIVTTDRGALRETIAFGAGVLIPGSPWEDSYAELFSQAVLSYVQNDQLWKAASIAGLEKAATLDWAAVAQQWSDMFFKELSARKGTPETRARHFMRHSNIMVARELAKQHQLESVQTELTKQWGFVDTGDYEGQYQKIYAEQYQEVGTERQDEYYGLIAGEAPRFQEVRMWLLQHLEVKTLIDYGCAHGAFTIELSNLRPDLKVIGVDLDASILDRAQRNKVKNAKYPDNVLFYSSTEFTALNYEKADAVFAFEILEHVPEPWVLATELQRYVKPSGWFLATVPYGPWEYASYRTSPYRAHIWEFDMHDLRDMFRGKPKLSLSTQPAFISEVTGDPQGWFWIEYQVDGTDCNPIDMVRKVSLVRPRETVSVNMIAGPGSEQTLRWCLEALVDVQDELIIVDCGLSAEAQAIAISYGAKLVKGSDPKQAGFETPRNEGLQHCTMDWILWLDTDEKLLGARYIHKYLRWNCHDGYSIRQHHFAVDTHFDPDMPVRLFRNGRGLRWFGMIHEHPEKVLNEGPGSTIVISDAHIAHLGYLVEDIRRKRFERNYPLLKKDIEKYPDRILQKHFIMRDNMLLSMYELQQNGGKVTDEIKHRCDETISLYRKYFLGKPHYAHIDSLQYYSQAVTMLGKGIEVAFQMAASKDKAQVNGTSVYRFASNEDAEVEILARTKEKLAQFPVGQVW